MDKTMADKLMCIPNDDTQNYPSEDYKNVWTLQTNQQIKI